MAELMESYEHQYSGLSAEITSQISKIPNLTREAKKDAINTVDRLLEEARELLEQMDLEVKSLPSDIRSKFSTRFRSYETELARLEKEFRKSKSSYSDRVLRDELLNGEDVSHFENQRARLLDNTESIERMERTVDNSFQISVETEEIGSQILTDLHSQREQINKSRARLRETDAILGKSSRVLTGMMKRIVQNRILLVGVIFIILTTVVVGVYLIVRKSKQT